MLREITSTFRTIDRATNVKMPKFNIKPVYSHDCWIDYENDHRVYYNNMYEAANDLVTRLNGLQDAYDDLCMLYDELAAKHNNLCDEYSRLSCGETA